MSRLTANGYNTHRNVAGANARGGMRALGCRGRPVEGGRRPLCAQDLHAAGRWSHGRRAKSNSRNKDGEIHLLAEGGQWRRPAAPDTATGDETPARFRFGCKRLALRRAFGPALLHHVVGDFSPEKEGAKFDSP